MGITWTSDYWGTLATGTITADISVENGPHGWFRIKTGQLDQHIHLVGRPRHFGGRQWFFVCPYLNRRCMVLWMPPGARSFACRRRWGGQVAYHSQFLDRDNLAHLGQARIKSRLCLVGGFDPNEWDFPPKPKWMRWSTYRRAEEKFDRYDATLDEGVVQLAMRFGIRI